jgi:hypothetical protein
MLGKSFGFVKRHFATGATTQSLKRTHLYSYHKDVLKGKIVPFAGYEMPV